MTKKQLSTDITTSVISALLSLVLVILILLFCVLNGFKALTSPKAIRNAVARIGSETLSADYPEIKKTFEMFKFTPQQAEMFLESDTAAEMFALYSKDILNVMAGKTEEKSNFTAENVQGVMVSNLDELTEISLEGNEGQDALEVERRIFKTIKKGTPGFVKSFPDVKKLSVQFQNSGYSFFFKILTMESIPKILIISMLVLAAAIYFLRSYKFWGILWLGNNVIIGAVLVGIWAIICVVGVGEYMFSGFMTDFNFARAFGWELFLELIINCGILCLMAVAFYIVYSRLKKHFYGKKKA